MSQIPFVNALGDAIEHAVADQTTAPRRRWIRMPRGRGKLAALVATLAVGGAAYAATQQNETKLVTAGIGCIDAKNWNAADAGYDVEARGRSPQAACAPEIGVAASKLVACRDPHGYAIVFERDGAPGQCRRLGLAPLQVAPFISAARHVQTLVRQLWTFDAGHRCIPFRTLQRRVQRVLRGLGWTGWRAEIQRRPAADPAVSGRCGMFEATGQYISDPTASLDGQDRVVAIIPRPPRKVLLRREQRTGHGGG